MEDKRERLGDGESSLTVKGEVADRTRLQVQSSVEVRGNLIRLQTGNLERMRICRQRESHRDGEKEQMDQIKQCECKLEGEKKKQFRQ